MSAIFQPILDRGIPPRSFVDRLVSWGRTEEDAVFEENDNPADIYALIGPRLGPWKGLLHRKGGLLAAALVHGMFESSGNFQEGVDKTNHHSLTHREGEEAGAWQMSFDMEHLNHDAMKPFALANGLDTPEHFIERVKDNPELDLKVYARLVRINIRWAGPLIRREILPWVTPEIAAEFMERLS